MTAPIANIPYVSTHESARESAHDHVARVLDLVGAHALAFDALLSVSRVEWSESIQTACVECIDRPRLLLNPAFVAQHCHTAERLAALVLHELMHISLGHTRLFARPTPLHNIAFDAIINRLVLGALCKAGASVDDFAALFTELYEAHEAPGFLLRPPPGWPYRSDWQASRALPETLRSIHRRLYGGGIDDAAATHARVTYGEIMEALRSTGKAPLCDLKLLGAHGDTDVERAVLANGRDAHAHQDLANVMNSLSGLTPGAGGFGAEQRIADATRSRAMETALYRILTQCVSRNASASTRWTWRERPARVVHAMQDRRAACRLHVARAFGAPRPLLFDGQVLERRSVPTKVFIYLDVSGSMHGVLPVLRRTLLALGERVNPELYVFSTEVRRADLGQFARGNVWTTCGTSITPVIRHAAEHVPRGTAALVLTDGYVERVPSAVSELLRAAGVSLHVGIAGTGPSLGGASWVSRCVRLPHQGR